MPPKKSQLSKLQGKGKGKTISAKARSRGRGKNPEDSSGEEDGSDASSSSTAVPTTSSCMVAKAARPQAGEAGDKKIIQPPSRHANEIRIRRDIRASN